MGNIGETPGELVVRKGIEARITEFFNAGDMAQTDANLEVWPHGQFRVLSKEVIVVPVEVV